MFKLKSKTSLSISFKMFSHVGFKAPNADIRVRQVTQTNELFKRTNNETNKNIEIISELKVRNAGRSRN